MLSNPSPQLLLILSGSSNPKVRMNQFLIPKRRGNKVLDTAGSATIF
jgi:hypothetical protein